MEPGSQPDPCLLIRRGKAAGAGIPARKETVNDCPGPGHPPGGSRPRQVHGGLADLACRPQAPRAHPHGFLAISSLHWLTETPQRFDDAPGAWATGPDGVTVELAEGEELVIGGAVVTWLALVRDDSRAGRD